MDKIVIEGGVPLKGSVEVSGAKNAALPIMAACLLTDQPCYLSNLPLLKDVDTICQLLKDLGVRAEDGREYLIQAGRLTSCEAPYELVKTMRASVLVLGPLLARMGRARVSLPGGCAIGERPIDLHLKGLKALGASIEIQHGYVEARADRLKGTTIYLDLPTVTGTENLMMAAALAHGETVIENAAKEPEVAELALVLNKMGAKITGAGTSIITIKGTQRLKGFQHTIGPDRIETGTFMLAAALTGGEITIPNAIASHQMALIEKLREAGVVVEEEPVLKVMGTGRTRSLDITTAPFPGFATDMQAQFMVLLAISEGVGVVTETVFENRFMHVAELRRMGADIEIKGPSAIVRGVPFLSGAPVMATDLRASASLILAGLTARGTTEVSRIYHLDRGYEKIEEKLAQLGAKIKRVRE